MIQTEVLSQVCRQSTNGQGRADLSASQERPNSDCKTQIKNRMSVKAMNTDAELSAIELQNDTK